MNPYTTAFSILTTSSALEETRKQLTDRLKQMADLPHGWSHGEGAPVSWLAIGVAQRYVAMASQLNLAADVFPNPDGGCAVAFYRGDEMVEVAVSSDGQRLALRAERGIGYEFENIIDPIEQASSQQVYRQILKLIENDLWKSFEPSIYASTGLTLNVSGTSHIATRLPPPMDRPLRTDVGGSQSSKPLVPVAR